MDNYTNIESERKGVEKILADNREDFMRLVKFLPWLIDKAGKNTVSQYDNDGVNKLTMPVSFNTPL